MRVTTTERLQEIKRKEAECEELNGELNRKLEACHKQQVLFLHKWKPLDGVTCSYCF